MKFLTALHYAFYLAAASTPPVTAGDVTLAPITVSQYSNTLIDLTPHVPAGSYIYGRDLPDGLEAMTAVHKVLGAPMNAGAETTYSILVIPPTTKAFNVHIPLTVTASSDPVYNVTTVAELFALTEFGLSYTGPGCTINLAAGDYDLTGQTFSNRFLGLTSMLVIKSADPANRARLMNEPVNFAGADGTTVGNVALVEVDVHVPELNNPKQLGESLLVRNIVATAGQGIAANITIANCNISSTVGRAADRYQPSDEMCAFRLGAPCDGLTLYNNTFSEVFNGILGATNSMLISRNTLTNSWGDLFRCSPPSKTGYRQINTILFADNVLKESTSDGAIRHADLMQMGGGGTFTDYSVTDLEARGNTGMDPLVETELPAIAPEFVNTRAAVYTTNQTALPDDKTLYRMNTDAGNLTFTLPDISTVTTSGGVIWGLCVQNYAALGNGVTVNAFGSDTINGASTYPVNGNWKAVRFYKATATSTEWSTQIYGVGHQTFLLQDDGGLAEFRNGLIAHNVALGGQRSGIVNEVNTYNVTIENNTLIPAVYGDTDGDGFIDIADGQGAGGWPEIAMGGTDPTTTLTVRNNICAGVSNLGPGTLTASQNFVDLDGTVPTTVTSRFVGEGARVGTRDALLAGALLKPGTDLDNLNGTVGALRDSLTSGGYDYVARRPIPPGVAETTLTLFTSSPAAGATGLAVDANFVLQFNQPVIGGTGNVILRTGGAAVETFDVATGLGDNGGTVSFADNEMIVNPGADMATGTTYAIQVGATAVEAKVGPEFYAGIADDTTLAFTTSSSAISYANAIAGGDDPVASVDYRTIHTPVTSLGVSWVDSASVSIDTGNTFNPNMSQATEDALNAAGTYVAMVDAVRQPSGLLRVLHRSEGALGGNSTMFYNSGNDTINAGASVDSTGSVDVSALYGHAAGTVTRVYMVYTNGVSTRAMASFNDSSTFLVRRVAVFSASTFSSDPVVRETQIGAIVP